MRIDALNWTEVIERLTTWAQAGESRTVAICNAHVIVTATRDPVFRQAIECADMATPDGAPVAWMLRRTGFPGQPRISGPDVMWSLCERCARMNIPIFLYGSTEGTLVALKARLLAAFPALKVAGMASPPFRPLSPEEDQRAIAELNASGAGVVFIGLGCPRQELWMAEHRAKVQAVMIGVGAAFDFHAGVVRRAPVWMQNLGLEWLHRLLSEPRRLWRRYLVTNALFVIGALRQLAGHRSGAPR